MIAAPKWISALLAGTVLLSAHQTFAAGATATAKSAGRQGDSLTSIKQLPDWRGVWQPLDAKGAKAEYAVKPALSQGWTKRFDELKVLADAGKTIPSRTNNCVTRGAPGGMYDPMALIEFYYAPKRVIVADHTGWSRRIYTDGRKHENLVDTFQGDSIGHWENGTLVADTEALDLNNEFLVGLNLGEKSHVVERLFLTEPNTLQIDTTIDAPQSLTAAYSRTTHYRRHQDWMMTEYDCVFDNLDTNRAIVR